MTGVDYASQTEPVLVHKNGRVVTVELNRPQSLNALDVELLRCLGQILKDISTNDEVEIVILKGAGKAFSAGGDIKTMLQLDGSEKDFHTVMDCVNELAVTLYCMPKLTLCEVQGAAAGLGLSIALATDYIIADRDAKIAMNFIGIGLIPDGGAHFLLSQRIGDVKAKELIWKGEVLTAHDALQKELIHEIAKSSLEEAVQSKVDQWLHSPLQAMIKTKKILAERNRPCMLKMLEMEKCGQSEMRKTEDHHEGLTAFLEKRKPSFKGK